MVSDRLPLVCVVVLSLCMANASTALAQKDFFIPNQALLAGSTDQEILLKANSDIPFLGYSFGLQYDENVLTVKSVTTEGAQISDPAYFMGMVSGGMVGYGCVFDFQDPFRAIDPGSDITLCKIIVDVAPDVDAETTIALGDVPFHPDRPVRNILTNEEGFSEAPNLVNGVLTIQTRKPEIVSIEGNEGLAGQEFTVTGNFFGEPGLVVMVCDAEAAATLNGDVLTVTAPECGTLGFAEIVVTTDRGTDSEANGFNYLEPPPEDVVVSGVNPSSGPAGTEVSISGANFDGPELEVTICDSVDPGATLEADGTITATVPDCGEAGEVVVQVCQGADNCDSTTFNFTVDMPPEGTPFRRGDPQDAGSVNISSPIFILNFLFGGGGDQPACFEASDIDNDGQVNVSDPINLLNHLFGDGAPPAAPGLDECGLDPDEPGSDKDLGCDRYDSC